MTEEFYTYITKQNDRWDLIAYEYYNNALLYEEIIKAIKNGYTTFISGMALGIDTYAAEIVLDLKSQFPFITLECAIPCETQAAKWSERYRNRYFGIVERCDKETMLQRHYSSDCMQKRNRYMVEHADLILAVWDGQPSGTGMTVTYAHSLGKPVWTLDPNTFSVTVE